MPKQTPPRTPKKSGPYQGSKTRPAMTTAAMNQGRMSNPMTPHQSTPWHNPSQRSMPPPIATFDHRRTAAPGSPTTPGTPSSIAPWSTQDDEILLTARTQGHGWNQIQSQNFPTKTPNACRKRYERLIAKRRGSDWDNDRVDRVTRRYMELRENMWRPLAEAEGENWEDVERLFLERGARNLFPTMPPGQSQRRGSEHESRGGSHDSHDEEKLRINNLLQ